MGVYHSIGFLLWGEKSVNLRCDVKLVILFDNCFVNKL